MNTYTLVYPNGKTERIRIESTLSVGDAITWGDSLKVIAITHKLTPESFDPSITHTVETCVVLALAQENKQ